MSIRDSRISLLLLLSFILLLASFLVLCIWGYNFYRTADARQSKIQPAVNSAEDLSRDSLLRIYTSTIQNLEQKLGTTYADADTLETNLSAKLDEYARLKNELTALLSNPTSDEDFTKARRKIDELQQRMQELRRTNNNVTAENQKLYDLLTQMQQNQESSNAAIEPRASVVKEPVRTVTKTTFPPPTDTDDEEDMPLVTATPVKKLAPTVAPAVFSTYDLSLERVSNSRNNSTELIGSFAVKNNTAITTNDDLMIVVVQPNGKVLQKSAWESGTFQTTSGKKIYSCKLRIENARGEARKVTFSLKSDEDINGVYTLQVFHKGVLIGNVQKRV